LDPVVHLELFEDVRGNDDLWIWLVPSLICRILASRIIFSTGYLSCSHIHEDWRLGEPSCHVRCVYLHIALSGIVSDAGIPILAV
jgi:hypothetical protein